jgi:hypothetical protein
MEKIFEDKSLQFIINAINIGMVEYESIESLKIISKNKPDFFIKIVDVDITDYVSSMISKSHLKEEIDFCETNYYDYIVFGKNINENKKTLTIIGLLELISISDKIVTEDKQIRSEETLNSNIWSLNTNDWDLIEEK